MGTCISRQPPADMPPVQRNHIITPLTLKIRCNTMLKNIDRVEKSYTFNKEHLLKKALRVADYTKYGVNLPGSAYTPYEVKFIIDRIEEYQYNITIAKFSKAADFIKEIQRIIEAKDTNSNSNINSNLF